MAMMVQPAQMRIREAITVILLVLELSGVMMALLLSRVMANIVNTLAGTWEFILNISPHSVCVVPLVCQHYPPL